MGLRLNDGGGNHVELSAPSLTSDVSLTLPNSIGTAGQFLQVGANGVTTWATAVNLIVSADASISDAQVGQVTTCTNPTVLSGTTPYTFTYQWQFQVNGGSSFSNISGATSQTYTVPAQIGSDNTTDGQLRCVVNVADSTTPTALTASSTSAAKTIAAEIYDGTVGRLYYYNSTSGWLSMTVNGSTTTNVRNTNAGPNSYFYVISEDYKVWQSASSNNYLSNANSDITSYFGSTAALAGGVRNIALSNNTNAHGVGQDRFAAHLVTNNDVAQGTQNNQGSMTYMSSTYPGYECLALMNTGFCSNTAYALIENSAGDRKIVNTWYYGTNTWTGSPLNAWQDVTPTLPSGEKVKQIFGIYYGGSVQPLCVGFLTDSGNIYTVGNPGGTVTGISSSGTLASPVQYNPTGFTAIEEVSVFGNGVGGANSSGFSMKGKDGHLYLVTQNHAFRKILDDVATPIHAGGYGQQNLVAMQDGSFRWMASAGLNVATPSWTTISGPSGLTVNTSGWKLFPSHQHGQCSNFTGGGNSLPMIIPYT